GGAAQAAAAAGQADHREHRHRPPHGGQLRERAGAGGRGRHRPPPSRSRTGESAGGGAPPVVCFDGGWGTGGGVDPTPGGGDTVGSTSPATGGGWFAYRAVRTSVALGSGTAPDTTDDSDPHASVTAAGMPVEVLVPSSLHSVTSGGLASSLMSGRVSRVPDEPL